MNKLTEYILKDSQKIYKNIDFRQLFGKHILITGASGMVGIYFLACLKHLSNDFPKSFTLTAIIHSDPSPYLKELVNYEGANLVQGDLSNSIFCQSLPNIDFVIHAAGYAQPGRFLLNPEKTLKINTATIFELFGKLVEDGTLLFVSSSEVYSGSPGGKYREDQIGNSNTDHPRSCYIEGKRCGEAICNAYRSKGINAMSARLSLAYGPGTKKGDKRALPSFVEKALKDKNIALQDEGKAIRTYCYVTDAVEHMWNILFRGTQCVYNVGGYSKISIAELAQKIGGQLGVSVDVPSGKTDTLAGSPKDVSLDMKRAEEELGKKDYVSLDEGLSHTIGWYKELYLKR